MSGAEPLLYSLLSRLEWDLAMGTSSLHCLKLDPVLRKSVADILVPTSKIKVSVATVSSVFAVSCVMLSEDILYVIVIAQGRVITLVKPQYEAEPAQLKGGCVPDEHLSAVLEQCRRDVGELGWRSGGEIESPIRGHGGNREFVWLLTPGR